jgi:hypothetical protein
MTDLIGETLLHESNLYGKQASYTCWPITDIYLSIFLWIYLLDHAFVIFNNLPPRMVIKEMSMHMAFPEAAFQASTSTECARELQNWHLRSTPLRNITFREVVESFCGRSFSNDMRRLFADLGPLNLFAVVSGKTTKQASTTLLFWYMLQPSMHWYFNTKTLLVAMINYRQFATLSIIGNQLGKHTQMNSHSHRRMSWLTDIMWQRRIYGGG